MNELLNNLLARNLFKEILNIYIMTENKNCSRCLSTTLSENDFGVNKYNEYFKTCNDCREYSNQKRQTIENT